MKWLFLGLAGAFIIAAAFVLSLNVWLWTSGIALAAAILGPPLLRRQPITRPKRNTRRPKIYGESRPATISEMAEGGITTERR
jgi:hypothetical protein